MVRKRSPVRIRAWAPRTNVFLFFPTNRRTAATAPQCVLNGIWVPLVPTNRDSRFYKMRLTVRICPPKILCASCQRHPGLHAAHNGRKEHTLMQVLRLSYGVRGFVRLNASAVRWAHMIAKTAKDRARILAFWEKHGLEAAREAFGAKRSTLYAWKQKLQKERVCGLPCRRAARCPSVQRETPGSSPLAQRGTTASRAEAAISRPIPCGELTPRVQEVVAGYRAFICEEFLIQWIRQAHHT